MLSQASTHPQTENYPVVEMSNDMQYSSLLIKTLVEMTALVEQR
jgi:hypothetical protein